MAALWPCPSRHVVGASLLRLSASPPRIVQLQPFGRRGSGGTSLLRIKTSAGRPAQWLRHRRSSAVDGRSGLDPDDEKRMIEKQVKIWRETSKEKIKEHDELEKAMPFREDGEKIDAVVEKMRSWKVSIFDVKATTLSLYLCMITRSGVDFANTVMESATLRVDKQFGISSLTTKQTLALYVPIFVKLTEDTYNQKFNEESVLSLIGAFRGVAAVGHILLKDALANVNPVGHISSNHSSVQEADNAWREFEQKMNNLEEKFRAASNSTKAFQILKPTMDDAMTLTMFFVSAVVARHERVLGYVPGTKGRKRSTMALGDEGPDALGTGSGSMSGT